MRRAYLTLVGVTLWWGTIPLIVREVEMDGLAQAAVRLTVASLALGLAITWRHRAGLDSGRPALLSRDRLACAAVSAVLAVHWAALFLAYKRAPVSTVILVVYLAPVGVAAIAPRVLGERHGPRTLAALAVGLAGLVLVTVPSMGDTSAAGLGFAAVAAVTFVALIVISKPLAGVYGGLRTAFLEFTGAAVLLLPVALVTVEPASWDLGAAQWAWLAVLGLFHTGLLVALYLGALARVSATHTGILGYLEPACAVTLSWLFLNEQLTATTVAGGALIVVAGALVVTSAADANQSEVPAHVPG